MAENRLQKFFEEGVLIYIIVTKMLQLFNLTSVLERFGIYSGEIAYIDSILSITALAYILYQAHFSEIFFGKKHEHLDLLIILCYLLLITNKLVEYNEIYVNDSPTPHLYINQTVLSSLSPSEQEMISNSDELSTQYLLKKGALYIPDNETRIEPFFYSIASIVANNGISLQKTGFVAGNVLILLISLFVAYKIEITGPSIAQTILNHGSPRKISKFLVSFLILIATYLIFFNFVIEWLSVVIDAPIMFIAIILYVFKLHGIGKSMDQEMILYKITNTLEEGFEEFINLFHSRKTILLGISGLLILHLITDMSAFIIPYAINSSSLYTEGQITSHQPMLQLFLKDFGTASDKTTLIFSFFGYIFNTIAIMFLMLFPAFIWFVIYMKKARGITEMFNFPNYLIALFYSSLVYLVFLPAYIVKDFNPEAVTEFIGVDIQTQSILTGGNSLLTFTVIAILVFIVVYILSNLIWIKTTLFLVLTLIVMAFFGIYTYNYFYSLFFYYVASLKGFIATGTLFFTFYILVFMVITSAFYIGGYLSFLVSVFKD